MKGSIYLKLSKDIFGSVETIEDGPEWIKLRQVRSLFKRFDIYHVASGPVNDSYVQYASHLVSQVSREGCYLIDDGLFSYQKIDNKKISYIEYLFRKIMWGSWYELPATYRVQSKWIYGAYLLHKHLFVNTKKQVHYLQSDWLGLLRKENFFDSLLSFYSLSKLDVYEIKKLVILGILKDNLSSSPTYQQDVESFLAKLVLEAGKVGIKFHPREKQRSDIVGFFTLPRGIPFELLFGVLNDDVEVIGDISSVLLDFKMFRPEAKVIAVTNYREGMDESIALMKKLDIEVVRTYRELAEQ